MASNTTPNAKVPTQQYTAGTGWDVGDAAPATLYVALNDQGGPTGPVRETHPGDRAMVVTSEGQQVTSDARRLLDAQGTDDTNSTGK